MKRAVIIVMDSLGVGQLPDAEKFGDKGASTFNHILENTPDFKVPNLRELGFCNIENIAEGRLAVNKPRGAYGRLAEASLGKDTTTGHWEIGGILTKIPFKTYPDGFPKKFIDKFQKAIGREVIGNYVASGTEIINELGEEHEMTGRPIVYTSADSVFQIAANTEVLSLEELYEICEKARTLLVGEFACGRVIARPYVIRDNQRVRTSDRHDYSVTPPEETLLDKIEKAGKRVHSVGKIKDIFAGRGITTAVHTDSNMDGVDKTIEALKEDFSGLIFTNLVDFDSLYGHRRDPQGYGQAIMDFDKRLPQIIEALKEEDILFICADHGNDPTYTGFDHTREYIPLLVYGKNIKNINLETGDTFANIGATISEYLECEETSIGKSFLGRILK